MIKWMKDDPFGFVITICACLAIASCTAKDIYKDWHKILIEESK